MGHSLRLKFPVHRNAHQQKGFTIVELLIVIVVIGILASITIVAYSGIQQRARNVALTSALVQHAKTLQIHYVQTNAFPEVLSDVGIVDTDTITYGYQKSADSSWYCVVATTEVTSYSVEPSASPSPGTCSQLQMTIYDGQALSGTPLLVTFAPNINYSWGGGPAASGMPADNFSVRWAGYITAPVTGSYTFSAISDDTQRLFVNEATVIDSWSGSCCGVYTGTINLIANQKVPFVYEMREGGGSAYARVSWSYPGQTNTIIPPSAFNKN